MRWIPSKREITLRSHFPILSPRIWTTVATGREPEAHGVENWVLREMGFSVARKHTRKLRRMAGILGFAVPALCLIAVAANIAPVALAWLAVASVSIGVVVERWLFFAEARHVVGLYYGLA